MHIEMWEMIEKEKQHEMIWNMILDLFRKEIGFENIHGYNDIKDIVKRAMPKTIITCDSLDLQLVQRTIASYFNKYSGFYRLILSIF